MPITTIEPNAALLVIDLQEGFAGLPTLQPLRDVAAQTGALASAFREHGHPVVLVTTDGVAPGRTDQGEPHSTRFPDGFADLLPELVRQDDDHIITKDRWGAFHETGLAQHLADLGVTQVVITGVATSIGVESTARAAYDRGLHVAIVTDAVTDTDQHAHENSLRHTLPNLGETGTTAEVTAALDH